MLLSKNELIEALDQMQKVEKNKTYKNNIALVRKYVNMGACDMYRVNPTSTGRINLGDVCECVALYYFDLNSENDTHEIKSFINHGWHTLSDTGRMVVYIVVVNTSDIIKNGLYRIEASKILNKPIKTLKDLKALKPEYITSITNLFKCIK